MRYRYFITKEQQTKVDKENFGADVLERLERITMSTKDENLESIGNGIYLKRIQKHSRPTFCWFMVAKDDLQVFVLRHVYLHDEYRDQINKSKRKSWVDSHNYSAIEELEIEDFINSVLTEPVVTEEEKPSLNLSELNFLSTQLNINHELFDVTIYETKNWIKDVQEEGFNDYSNAASTIKEYIENNLYSENGWYVIEFKKIAILAYHINDDWVLDKILERQDDKDYDKYIKDSNGNYKKCPENFQRGYPYDFLSDEDEWRLMEKDKRSNLVLSQQQVEIVSGDIQFPLFLTGRAGSGKSTMLQYLFAEIVLRYLNTIKQCDDGLRLPVYLSYSSNLITDARGLCKTLFEKNNVYSKQLREGNISYKEDISPLMDNMFFVFNDLLRLCIDENLAGESFKLFPVDKYISFPIFNSEWNKKYGKIRNAAKKYGPSISWHVIRTYIKGWDGNNYMTPEEYATIGEKNQTVSPETFKVIYEEVWEKWYSLMEDAWDDQDIVRYCLEHNLVDDRYSAVFCDESQDFTRVEIDFILRLSSFSNRSLQNVNDIKKLPFVFAGDEFQTLNPTGFSWASLSSYFTESLCNSTGLGQYKNELGIPDPIELSENFRSTRQVVKLANRVQLLRASRFGEYSKPQTPHFSEDGNSIYCVSPSNKFIFDKLKEKKVILIIPAADGESVEDYIANTPLKDQIEFDKGVPQDITILNPTQAKGLEYPNVAVYGFNCDGQYTPLGLNNLLNWFSNPDNDAISDIELKYQISNAYVAVTRAGSNLYILDDFNENSFWSFAFNHDDPKVSTKISQLQEQMFKQLPYGQRDYWSVDNLLGWIDYMPEGVDVTDENLSYLKSEEHKNDLENRAEALHDPKLMRQAACIHKSAGNKKDEARCKAKAYYFEEDYLQAANWFERAEDYEAAIDNYWIQLNHTPDQSLISKIAQLKDQSQNIKVRLCVMCANPSVRGLKLAIDDTLTALRHNLGEHATIDAWQFVLNYMLQNIQAKKKEGLHDIPVIASKRQQLLDCDIELNLEKLALLAYQIGALDNAVGLWEALDYAKRPQEFFRAKLNMLKYPDTIEYYEGTGDENWKEKLLQEYRKYPDQNLNDVQKRVMTSVIITVGDREELMKFLPFMLRDAQTIDASLKVLDEAGKIGCEFNKKALTSLIEARHSNLSNWKRPRIKFVDPEATYLFDAIEAIKRMREDDFADFLNRSLRSMKVIDFGKRYNAFSRKVVSKLVFLELGKRFESRDSFIDSVRYYEWARNQSDDESFKRAMDIRWVACRERQAGYEKEDSTKKAIFTKEALDKRRDLHLSFDEKLAVSPELTSSEWEDLFTFYINISKEEVPSDKKKEKKVKNEEVKTDDIPKTDRSKLKKQELHYNKYSVGFFPGKGDVVIRDTENDYQVRIKDGNFPEDGDFILKGTRVYASDDDTPTPFVFERNENNLIIKVYELDEYTGMAISINLVS